MAKPITILGEQWISERTLRLMLGVSTRTWHKVKGTLPVRVFRIPGAMPRYSKSDADALVASTVARLDDGAKSNGKPNK
jgi:hypothetical protein